jgi:hypothetical protein
MPSTERGLGQTSSRGTSLTPSWCGVGSAGFEVMRLDDPFVKWVSAERIGGNPSRHVAYERYSSEGGSGLR